MVADLLFATIFHKGDYNDSWKETKVFGVGVGVGVVVGVVVAVRKGVSMIRGKKQKYLGSGTWTVQACGDEASLVPGSDAGGSKVLSMKQESPSL